MATTAVLDRQLAELRRAYTSAAIADAGDGTNILSVELELPTGWNLATVTAEFVVSAAYPTGQPDCFFADAELRLVNGGLPANTGLQPLRGELRLWFSWHLQQPWQPNRHTLVTYARFIQERLRRAN
jgi:hypothetical protein